MTTKTEIIIPTVRNIYEAARIAHKFPAVITVGPSKDEVAFGHPNHYVRTFDDVIMGDSAPQHKDVEAVLDFASINSGPRLIHCHAGMSRSTSMAIAVMINEGADPFEAFDRLKAIHPHNRDFIPNPRIMRIIEDIFGLNGFVQYSRENEFSPDGIWLD